MSDHVLVVGGGMTMPGLLRSLGTDVRTSVVCQLAIVPKLREQHLHQRILGLRAEASDQEWLAIASAVHRLDPFTKIASFAERDQDRAAVIAEELGLPMHTKQTIHWVHHKPSMRERLSALGMDDTPHAIVRSVAELREFARIHGFPCIAKPAVGAGSIGIRQIETEADLATAFDAADVTGEWTSGGVLVERLHIGGVQVSVEAFSDEGTHEIVCVTQKYSDPFTHVEVGHVLPAEVSADQLTAISTYVRSVLSALEIGFGPTHTELVLTENGPRIIETHTRLAGDCIPPAGPGRSCGEPDRVHRPPGPRRTESPRRAPRRARPRGDATTQVRGNLVRVKRDGLHARVDKRPRGGSAPRGCARGGAVPRCWCQVGATARFEFTVRTCSCVCG